jgi:hypothetical protein
VADQTPLEAALADIRYRLGNQSRENQIIAEMWAYHADLGRQARNYAGAKSAYQKRKSVIVMTRHMEGQKVVSTSEHAAEASDDVHEAHLAYRLAEQLINVNRAALNILHAELDKIRTERADARAADQHQARTGT